MEGEQMPRYDLAVIGLGLIGSAALRHLTLHCPELRICGVGPGEPADRKSHCGVFSSHYDQGRITRVLDPSEDWGALAQASIRRYAAIEAESGVRFHHRVGCLRATDIAERIAEVDACADRHCPPHRRLDAAGVKAAYPFLAFSDRFVAWDERGDAGYINPRSLIAAQLKIAGDRGADIIPEIVSSIDSRGDAVTIRTREGSLLRARKLLLAVGGYSNTLLHRKLVLPTKGHTILLAQMPPEEIERLRAMPAIISTFDHDTVSSLYMLPPLPYPDGKTYIKLGLSGGLQELPAPEPFFDAVNDDRQLLDWFRGDGRADIAEAMKTALQRMIPGLKARSFQAVPCLITNSAHGKPYIDALDDGRIYLATAGNGYAAKSSDEIGRIGAMLCARDEWRSDLNRDGFRAVYVEGGRK